eukprot:CAMPEP_0202901732 /NCGR_PEP_ID=MMETSP1392-20130828/14426_1 /ASSEMBLY_ACC=CAM_ASM_000868 /TAXON_ID=225041 /ORGANISM="Chlamydomonas chlamydogama, Strain SAG 11-48b" /LENGTH=32 /DNA_ID= /DNA_START= /DNA_END= /DNA_ORIENTATION=
MVEAGGEVMAAARALQVAAVGGRLMTEEPGME